MGTVGEVAEYVREFDWGRSEAASFEFASRLTRYARSYPRKAVEVLRLIVQNGFDPRAGNSIFSGLLDAVQRRGTFDWPVTLHAINGLFQRAAARDPAEDGRLQEWRRTVGYAARLIGEGCSNKAVPTDLADSVWDLLHGAGTVPVVREKAYSEEDTDLAGVLRAAQSDAVGDVTGAILQAAVWHYRCIVPETQGASPDDDITRSARHVVGERLTRFLDEWLDDEGPNRAVRLAVVGGSLPNVCFLVPEWLKARAKALLGGGVENPTESPAWTGYVWRARFYDGVFEALRRWYVEAAEKAEGWSLAVRECEFFHRDMPAIFAQHLLQAVERGLLSPDDSDGLLEVAYANLPPNGWDSAYRATYHAWTREMPTEKGVQRLVDVWRWRVAELQCRPTSSATIEEAKALAWFLRLPHMADDDLLELGPETAILAAGQFSLSRLRDRLVRLAEADADRAFLIVEAVFTAQLTEEHPYFPTKETKPFFQLVLTRGNSDTQDRARQLIHQLGERGDRDLMSLLRSNRDT